MSVDDVLARFPLSPEYTALTLLVPISSVLIEHCACPVVTVTATQPGNGVAPIWNNTVPVAVLGAMLAVKVTVCPDTLGLMPDTKPVAVPT